MTNYRFVVSCGYCLLSVVVAVVVAVVVSCGHCLLTVVVAVFGLLSFG